MKPVIDVIGIGNAIVDVVAATDDDFLAKHGMAKGGMALIDEAKADALYKDMGQAREVSGGSAANSMAAIAALGGKAAYIGIVRDDTLGRIFRHDIAAAGVQCAVPAVTGGPATARCLICVTPDGERTMNTYLGACVELGPEHINAVAIASARICYLEGYLFDKPRAQAAFKVAAEAAHAAGREVALSLSDSFCVQRHRAAFQDFIVNGVDILFANESEIMALYQAKDFATAAAQAAKDCKVVVLTRGAKGSEVFAHGAHHVISAAPLARVVDTTGAGDAYAGGFLFGYTQGFSPSAAAEIGGLAAAEVIGHYGARAPAPLREVAAIKAKLDMLKAV